MDYSNIFVTDFDRERRILHVAYSELIRLQTSRLVKEFFRAFEQIIHKFADDQKCYMIVDMSNLVIDPDLVQTYAEEAGKICKRYIYPRGVARYGYQITRITVRVGYSKIIKDDPNLFRTRSEAVGYIENLITQSHDEISSTTNSVKP